MITVSACLKWYLQEAVAIVTGLLQERQHILPMLRAYRRVVEVVAVAKMQEKPLSMCSHLLLLLQAVEEIHQLKEAVYKEQGRVRDCVSQVNVLSRKLEDLADENTALRCVAQDLIYGSEVLPDAEDAMRTLYNNVIRGFPGCTQSSMNHLVSNLYADC
jgi:hypothetical protein